MHCIFCQPPSLLWCWLGMTAGNATLFCRLCAMALEALILRELLLLLLLSCDWVLVLFLRQCWIWGARRTSICACSCSPRLCFSCCLQSHGWCELPNYGYYLDLVHEMRSKIFRIESNVSYFDEWSESQLAYFHILHDAFVVWWQAVQVCFNAITVNFSVMLYC